MASYDVNLYLSTGFNAVNVPDSPSTLTSAAGAVVSAPSVHILQNKFLSQVDISVSWSVAELCDYICIGDFYYSVTGAAMLTESTCRLYIVPDFITSAGGFSSLSILDGVTSRCTVSDDTFGKYTDDDPLTTPQKPLKLYGEWIANGGDTSAADPVTYISTTLDLAKQAQNTEGLTYVDSETGENVTVPVTYQIEEGDETSVTILGGDDDATVTGLKDGTAYYTLTATSRSGRARARSLGIEGAIISQWSVPGYYAGATADADTGKVSLLASRRRVTPISFPYEYYEGANNKRIEYGQYNRFGIITAAGNSMECKPEDLYYGTTDTAPSLDVRADPRPGGRPYYRFETVNGNRDFWRNCVSGEEWAQAPLVYEGASGSALTRLNFDNERRVASTLKGQYEEQNKVDRFNAAVSAFTGGLVSSERTATIGAARAGSAGISASNSAIGIGAAIVGGAVKAGMNYSIANEQKLRELDNYRTNYSIQKANELSQLYQETEVYEPQVVFPYNSSIIRDVKGNGVFAYRYEYDPEDLLRIDKLLTMYGYKCSEALTSANFSRRTYFDYVECSTVTVTGLPRWHADGVAAQLDTGVRIWHTKPSSSYYTNNPIKETTT